MSYLISNMEFEGASKYKDVFYVGEMCRVVGGSLCVAKRRSDLFNFDQVVSSLEFNSDKLITLNEFFVKCEYAPNESILKIQTDIIGFEPVFLYLDNGRFALSDSLTDILTLLNNIKIRTYLSLEDVRDQLYWGVNFGEKTIIKRIIRLGGGKVYSLDCKKGNLTSEIYEEFEPVNKVESPQKAAENLYRIIDERFSNNPNKDKVFGIGLSGGLDSRVAAFFAKRHGYRIKPFFIGDKYGRSGVLSYDAKRSIEVQKALDLLDVTFFATNRLSWHERIENDLVNAPSITSNAQNNIGYDFLDFDILLSGAMGGEMFGAQITPEVQNMTQEALADYLLKHITLIPKFYPTGFFSKVMNVPGRFVDEVDYEELINKEDFIKRRQIMLDWVFKYRRKGFSNVKIVQLDLYLRYAKNHSFAYLTSLNRQKNSFPVYLWPDVIKEMLSWDDSLFIDKKVQRQLLILIGKDLASIRSQFAAYSSLYSRIESFLRGGSGMKYQKHIDDSEYNALESMYKRKAGGLFEKIGLERPSWNLSPLLRISLLKFTLLAERYKLEV